MNGSTTNKSRRWLWHVLGWLLFTAYELSKYMEDLDGELAWIIIFNVLAKLITFYIVYRLYCTRLARFKKDWVLLFAIPLGVVTFIPVRYIVQEVFMRLLLGFGNYYNPSLTYYIEDNLFRGLFPIIAAILVFLLESRNKTKQEQKLLQAEKNQAELAFLRSQVNPHFLFNTLSFLHTRAFMVDEKLAEMILELSDVLRYSVKSSQMDKRSLAEEINLLHSYIGIFKKRFEGQCYIDLAIEGRALKQEIEPLLLLPFIENAFKHGRFTKPETPIKAQLKVEEGKLNFSCHNFIKLEQKDYSSGVGLENIRRRLTLLYPDKHQLEIQEKEDTFRVELSLIL